MKNRISLCFILFFFLHSSFGQSYNERYAKCSEILKDVAINDSTFGAKLVERNNCLIGANAPSFEVTTLDHKHYNLDSLQGRVVLLNFWFTRCIPCKEEIPFLNTIVAENKKDNLVCLSFANEDSTTVAQFIQTTKFDFEIVPNAFDILRNTFKLFSVWPTSIVIDKHGKIQFIQTGKLNENPEGFKKLLKELLQS